MHIPGPPSAQVNKGTASDRGPLSPVKIDGFCYGKEPLLAHQKPPECFATFTPDLDALADWLARCTWQWRRDNSKAVLGIDKRRDACLASYARYDSTGHVGTPDQNLPHGFVWWLASGPRPLTR
jgi:hypothetical protein